MGTLSYTGSPRSESGALMIEVLITIVILAIGLLGLMQMQGRLQKSEMESYQRTQALMLANDMAMRINANRAYAGDYETGTPLGVGANCGNPSTATTVKDIDHAEWCLALQGAAEVTDTSTNVGAMIGGRGCIDEIVEGEDYMITVVWQGFTPISRPPVSVTCGEGDYDMDYLPPDAACRANPDACRRYITTWVRIGSLKII